MTGITARGIVDVSIHKIKDLLTTTRGDIFQAACLMRTTFRELDHMIRRSEELSHFVRSIAEVKADEAYATFSDQQFAENLAYLSKQYRLEGLQEIHKLATVEADSAAMADVKLRAAIHLVGTQHGMRQGMNENLLKELMADYESAAPRIREIRQTVITMETPEPRLPTVSGTAIPQLPSDDADR